MIDKNTMYEGGMSDEQFGNVLGNVGQMERDSPMSGGDMMKSLPLLSFRFSKAVRHETSGQTEMNLATGKTASPFDALTKAWSPFMPGAIIKGMDTSKQPHEMTQSEFLGNPRITSAANAKDLVPKLGRSAASAPAEPFMGKYHIKRGAESHTVLHGDTPIAEYDGGNKLVVHPKYRRQGIAAELVADFRTKHPEMPPARERTKASQEVAKAAHRLIVQRALQAGKDVPSLVTQDYPGIRHGQ